jgi:hypothetical protein
MGPDSRQNKWNGMICAFQLQEQVPSFAAADSVISARAGRAVWVFGLADLLRDGRPRGAARP